MTDTKQTDTRSRFRVVYLHQYFKTPETPGATRSYEFARRLVERGHEVHVIATTNVSGGRAWNRKIVEGIHVHEFALPYSNHFDFWKRMKAFVVFAVRAGSRARRLKGDIIFATSTPLTIILPAIRAKWLRDTPIVFEVRDLWPDVPIAMGVLRDPLLKFAARLLERVAYRMSSEIVALSEGMAEGIRRVDRGRKTITIIPNAADRELFGSVPQEQVHAWRRERPWLGDGPLVVYTGTLGTVNNVSYLVRIAAETAKFDGSVKYLVVGDGREIELVKATAKSLGVLHRNFFMEPPVAKADLPVILAAATMTTSFVQPIKALEANSANKFFDSLAAGKPIAINHGGWQSQVLASTGAGIVLDSQDETRAAEQLVSALHDEKWLAKASNAAQILSNTTFSRDTLFEKFNKVISRVASHNTSK